MVKYSGKGKDDSDEERGNGDEEQYVEVEGEETKDMGGTFSGNNLE